MEEYVHIQREVLVLAHSTSTQPKRAEEGQEQEQEQEQEPLRRCASTSRACGVPSPAPFLCQQLDPNKFLEARQGLGQEPQSKAKGVWAGSNVSDTLRPPTLNQKSSSKLTRSSFSHQPAVFAADEPTNRAVFNPLT
ncbi:hypothetical protein X797_004149 [Metarhizium robertsii]|uniref:Uncharacterized protein n=1 Tax=Metarhizium robertsii TaxID=568076 RepID=A0A0A1V087_9HYPO|nr:hypothetical protein X797_004149 [Metarhizium robertsii]